MKLFASLVAAAAMTLTMLVATPVTSATAAPYPGTVATKSTYVAPSSVRRNRPVAVAYRVSARGNARPVGTVTVRVYKVVNGHYKFIRSITKRYSGNVARASLGKFAKGRYATLMSFKAAAGSVYKDSQSGVRSFRVR